MKKLLSIIFLLINFTAFSQNYTISGYIKDKETGEELLYAVVKVLNKNYATTSNQYGFYSLTIPKGQHNVLFSFLGYETDTIDFNLDKNITKNISLSKIENTIDKIVITGQSTDENVKSTNIGAIDIDIKDAKKIPILFGEQDILKTLQLMPGVSAASEGSSGFYVRGGDSDQNLILLDEAPVYNASHLLGFFSVFNSDALNDMLMYKGGIPAKFGGRLSSVTDIRMKNGNMNNWNVSGGIGIISSRLTLEGPLVKDYASIIASGRRTYADVVVKTFKEKYKDLVLYFYDFNLKTNIVLTKNDRIYLSGYLGRDDFGYNNFGFDWGNKTATFRWNHIFSNKVFSNISLVYSDFDYGFIFGFSDNVIHFGAGIHDYNVKQDINWYANANNSIGFGWQSMYHNFMPMAFKVVERNPEDTINAIKDTSLVPQYALESAVYLSNEQKIGSRITLLYGLRFSIFHNLGPYDFKTYDENNKPVDTFSYGKNEFYHNYKNFEPRLNVTFLINDENSLKASYNRTVQYLHLLTKSTASSPTDMWIPSSPNLSPEISDQVSLGFFRNFDDNKFELSTEFFYRNMYNQVDFEDGAQIYFNPDVEALILQGIGRAYGLEFLFRKKMGNFNGWVSYTVLKSERKFDDINNGNWFPARQDRRHDFETVLTYQLWNKLSFSLTWVYNTGDAVTFPVGKYVIDGVVINLYSERNSDRMPDYHRLDFGFTWIIRDSKKFYTDLNISVYNVYSRKNAYTINFYYNETSGMTEAERLALFGIVPSFTWNFRLK